MKVARPRRIVYRPRRYDLGALDPFDATVTVEPGAPEPIFDRVSGPYPRGPKGWGGPAGGKP